MHFQGLVGIALFIAFAWLISEHRRRIPWRLVAAALALQFVLAFLLLKFDPVVGAFDWLARGITTVIGFADKGTDFLFGKVADPSGPWGFIFAVRVLPVIIFFASLMAVLYHLKIMQRVVAGVAWVLRRTLGITGAEALSAAANIFVGQTEAPLTVKPYIAGMTRSQLMAVMVGGFATIAGSVMAAYITMLGKAYGTIVGNEADGMVLFAKHLITASVMSAPAGILCAKMIIPETESPRQESVDALMADNVETANVVDAAAAGATDGLKLALNVAAMLVAFVALLALVNWPLAALGDWKPVADWRAAHGLPPFSLQGLLGWVFTPVAWCMGVALDDCRPFGQLLGTQVIATEFLAYIDLAKHMNNETLSPRAAQIATYALCGFANIASIGIQIGGLSAMAPSRRADLAAIAPKAMTAGALACWMTGAVASVFI